MANAWAAKRGVGVLTLSSLRSDHYRLDPAVERIRLELTWESTGLWRRMRSTLLRSGMIRRVVREFRPRAVVSFVDQTNVRILAALIGTGVPVVACERVDPRRHRSGIGWRGARRLLYPRAAAVVVQTEPVAGWAKAFVPARKVHVIPNFVRDLPQPTGAVER
ncbi:MAG: glycosyltransferase family 4 protein, partial [Rhodospirillaceae bacterium]|nr:glycosyltransferase family 4 protein [Rhodospirillaceae bacterium]